MSDLRQRLSEVDSADQIGDVLAMPDHLLDALWRVESARIEPFEADSLLVCGMGGSAIGGDLAAAALGYRVTEPLIVVRGYELPSWTSTDAAVLCASYSGSTEETLATYAAAEALGARRIVATTGGALADSARADGVDVIGLPSGLQPRAAVGYAFVIAAEAATLAGAAPGLRTEIDSTAAHLTDSRDALLGRATEIAERIGDSVPVFYGCDLTGPVAYRWKTQVNENAKRLAFAGALPEADHNELVGWAGESAGNFSAIFLADCGQHPRERERFELTAELIGEHAHTTLTVETEGATPTERLLHAVMLGDLVSLALAAADGTDPTPVLSIERLKDRLGRP